MEGFNFVVGVVNGFVAVGFYFCSDWSEHCSLEFIWFFVFVRLHRPISKNKMNLNLSINKT